MTQDWKDKLREFLDGHRKLPPAPSRDIDWSRVGEPTEAEVEAFLDEVRDRGEQP